MRRTRPETTFFTVQLHRSDEFPVDMLRSDEAFPASTADAQMIAKLIRQDDAEIMAMPRIVEIRFGTCRLFGPEVKRWESFGCRVTAVDDTVLA